jgi:hypothetical protein
MRQLWAITWKEWLGLRWKLAALTAILVGTILCLLMVDPSLIPASHVSLFVVFGAIAPIFLAMHAAAEDNSAGTLEFVRGLPVPLFQLGLIRILATLAVLLVPLLLASFTVWILKTTSAWMPSDSRFAALAAGPGDVPDLLVVTGAAVAVSASLYLWTTTLAMDQPNELRAGLIGVATAIGWGVWTMFTVAQWDNGPWNWTWLYGITALGPFASLVMFDPGLSLEGRIAMGIGQFVALCTLVVFAARRYGILEWRRPELRPRLSTPNAALWWMQWRQSWPLGIAGLAAVLGLAMLSLTVASGDPHHGDTARYESLLYLWSVGVGSVWAIVVAAPLFAADLDPKLVAFWRSRPIDPADWFRIKYLTGALTVLLFIDFPGAWLGRPLDASKAESIIAFLACVPALHLAVYSLAVLCACLVRHTIYAGILAMGATLFIIVMPVLNGREELARLLWRADVGGPAQAVAAGQTDMLLLCVGIYLGFMLSIAIIATLLARWAIQRDIAVRM